MAVFTIFLGGIFFCYDWARCLGRSPSYVPICHPCFAPSVVRLRWFGLHLAVRIVQIDCFVGFKLFSLVLCYSEQQRVLLSTHGMWRWFTQLAFSILIFFISCWFRGDFLAQWNFVCLLLNHHHNLLFACCFCLGISDSRVLYSLSWELPMPPIDWFVTQEHDSIRIIIICDWSI